MAATNLLGHSVRGELAGVRAADVVRHAAAALGRDRVELDLEILQQQLAHEHRAARLAGRRLPAASAAVVAFLPAAA